MMLTSLLRDILILLTILISDIKVSAISPISGCNDSRKRYDKRLIFKIGTIHRRGFNERFSFIWSPHSFCFCPPWADKKRRLLTTSLHCLCSSTFLSFTWRLRLVYWSNLKIAKTYFCILLCICYCFSHLMGLFSVTWLFLLHKFTCFFNLFSVSLWRRANARNVRLYYPFR